MMGGRELGTGDGAFVLHGEKAVVTGLGPCVAYSVEPCCRGATRYGHCETGFLPALRRKHPLLVNYESNPAPAYSAPRSRQTLSSNCCSYPPSRPPLPWLVPKGAPDDWRGQGRQYLCPRLFHHDEGAPGLEPQKEARMLQHQHPAVLSRSSEQVWRPVLRRALSLLAWSLRANEAQSIGMDITCLFYNLLYNLFIFYSEHEEEKIKGGE